MVPFQLWCTEVSSEVVLFVESVILSTFDSKSFVVVSAKRADRNKILYEEKWETEDFDIKPGTLKRHHNKIVINRCKEINLCCRLATASWFDNVVKEQFYSAVSNWQIHNQVILHEERRIIRFGLCENVYTAVSLFYTKKIIHFAPSFYSLSWSWQIIAGVHSENVTLAHHRVFDWALSHTNSPCIYVHYCFISGRPFYILKKKK